MTDHKATPEQWAQCEEFLSNPVVGATDACLLELRARVEALEAMRETEKAAVLNLYRQHDELKDWVGRNYTRIKALEGDPIPEPEPIDEAENDRRFHACMDLIHNATPEQIRAAAGLPERSSLVKRVVSVIADPDGPEELWHDDARAAIREVAAWLRSQDLSTGDYWAGRLEQEAER